MPFQRTQATEKILQLNKRIRAVAGGTAASKTFSIVMWLIDYAQTHENELVSIVSESFPHLRRGAMRDFLLIMEEHGYFNDNSWSKTEYTYTFPSGSKIEFFSADQPQKVRGPRRDVLFINECNNVPYETFTQLEIRTKKIIWLDWNPVSSFWWYEDYMLHNDNFDFITLTYKDNEALAPEIVASIEAKKYNKNFWQVYGLGQLGEAEGRIYTDWAIIDEIPHEARMERHGLDFGYTNDPTALVGIYRHNSGFVLDEEVYQTGLKNREIADLIKNLPKALTIADSAEPKSIDELRELGVNIIPAPKGQGSVLQGIQYVQDQRISVTKRSINLIKEYRNYLWMTDKEGRVINEPSPYMNHALDAVRYGMTNMTDLGIHSPKIAQFKKPDLFTKGGIPK